LNAAGPENSAFDNWLGNSVAVAKQALGDAFQQLYEPSLGLFVFRGHDGEGGDEPERGMIGVWAASGDSAGRRYPMMVSTNYDYEQMLGVGPALPIVVFPFLAAAYDLVANGRGMQVDDFLGRVASLQPMGLDHPEASAAQYQTWTQQHTMRAFWETLYGTVDGRHAVVQSLYATLEIFRGHERPNTQLAVRVPIRAGDAYAVSVWLDMATRMAKWQRTVLNAFWTPQHDLVVHIGPPQPHTFRELITVTGQAEQITELLVPPATDEQTARHGLGAMAELVDNPDIPIAAFLAALA
jgi:type VI secretion system protein ImpM